MIENPKQYVLAVVLGTLTASFALNVLANLLAEYIIDRRKG
jgi:hypothetical protein